MQLQTRRIQLQSSFLSSTCYDLSRGLPSHYRTAVQRNGLHIITQPKTAPSEISTIELCCAVVCYNLQQYNRKKLEVRGFSSLGLKSYFSVAPSYNSQCLKRKSDFRSYDSSMERNYKLQFAQDKKQLLKSRSHRFINRTRAITKRGLYNF